MVLPLIGFSQINDSNIQDAVNLWVSNQSAAESTYGNISEWDVSNVTDMYQLFKNKQNFNDDISSWDVSNVTDRYCMLCYAYDFNQDIGGWAVQSVTDMQYMFIDSNSFNQEQKSNKDVKDFCEVNFNIDFPLTQITKVKGDDAHPLFLWAKNNFKVLPLFNSM